MPLINNPIPNPQPVNNPAEANWPNPVMEFMSVYEQAKRRGKPQNTVQIVANLQERNRGLVASLAEYDGYVTQRQMMEAVNRVLTAKKLKKWRPSLGTNKTDFLSDFINKLWEVLPDVDKDVGHESET